MAISSRLQMAVLSFRQISSKQDEEQKNDMNYLGMGVLF